MADPMADSPAWHAFGVRHHGPGCARSLLQALGRLQPDCLLIEGPPEAQELVAAVLSEHMRPPVALLTHSPEAPRHARYHPFAVFSPEWQALRWAAQNAVPVRFIDLPLTHVLALDKEQEDARLAALQAEEEAEQAAAAARQMTAEQAASEAAAVPVPSASPNSPNVSPETAEAAGAEQTTAEAENEAENEAADASEEPEEPTARTDPLDWLARAAGYADGEAWWNHMVEERGDSTELFAAIDEAMCALRAELPAPALPEAEARMEALREAHMRQSVRAALKDGFGRIAVVVGAWHLGGIKTGLAAKGGVKADAALLKGLPKLKVSSTWVPWTYRHLTRTSGYGAGIHSPGWYEHLWECSGQLPSANNHNAAHQRSVGWMARVARLMRERDLDCSSAHLIEASRLADALAAMRQRPAAGLDELNEATRCVLTLGDDSVLRFIHDDLIVGDRLGQVPPDVPAVPLQRDLERLQKSLRLKPEAAQRNLDLDLRQENDLARSHLLHRLKLLGLGWGRISSWGAGNVKGTFHEIWQLQWQPEFALKLIEASIWGETVALAASAFTLHQAKEVEDLPALSGLIDQALLADLPSAVQGLAEALAQRAALSSDTPQLLAALPALARVFRYGNVRQTDASLVASVLDQLALRAALALPLAACNLDEASAAALREALLAAHGAVALREDAELRQTWQRALAHVADRSDTHALLQGLASRLLLDDAVRDVESVAAAMTLHLSMGSDPAQAAAWLEGFLNRNATVLLHDATVWCLVDAWLCSLSEEHFSRVLPLVRRSFSAFEASDLRDLGERARQGRPHQVHHGAQAAAPELDWHAQRAVLPLPFLATVLGLAGPTLEPTLGATP